MGFRSCRPTRVSLLTAPVKRFTRHLTRQQLHWTVDEWKHVAWSYCQLYHADGRVRLLSQPDESIGLACQQKNVQTDGASVMVWVGCSWTDMGPLIRLETNLTEYRYVAILSDHLRPFMPNVPSDGLRQFEQNNASLQTQGVTTYWIQKHSFDFRHFHLPRKSQNMKIIDHIWDDLQRSVQKRPPPFALLKICGLPCSMHGVN